MQIILCELNNVPPVPCLYIPHCTTHSQNLYLPTYLLKLIVMLVYALGSVLIEDAHKYTEHAIYLRLQVLSVGIQFQLLSMF